MKPEKAADATAAWRARGWSVLAALAAVLSLLAIVPLRLWAHQFDFAVANVATLLLVCLAWLGIVFALARGGARRWIWQSMLLLPVLAGGMFLLLFRFERVDGELKPLFEFRWATPEPLAKLAPAQLAADPGIPVASLKSQDGDFPQFLGPARNASVPQVQLEADWAANPPQVLWKQAIGDGWSSFAVQGDVAVTMEQREHQEWVSAYSVLTGKLYWKYAIDSEHQHVAGGRGPRSTPSIANDRVYACSAVSRVVCLELATGKEVWARELLELIPASQQEFERNVTWGRSGSPLVVEHRLFVPLGGVDADRATLLALHRDTGKELWRGGDDQISYSSPTLATLAGVPQILLVSENELAAYAPDTGGKLWATDWPGSSSGAASVSQPVVVDDAHVLLSKAYGEGAQYLRISRNDPTTWQVEVLWSNSRALRTKFTNCVVHNGYAYGLSDGILECVDLSDGQRQWKNGRYRQGQLLLVGEHLLITSEGGEVVLVAADPSEFRELASLPVIGNVSWNPPALSGDRLLMRNSDQAACVRLPLANAEANASSGADIGVADVAAPLH